MTAALLMTALTLVPDQGVIVRGAPTTSDGPYSPLAPSVRVLSKEEQKRIEKIIDRFILYESNKISKQEGIQAKRDFDTLGPEAVFQLIDGLNRAAQIESSCPAIIIAHKLARIFAATQDVDLLDFARENIGAGVTARRHMNALKDLKLLCSLRKAQIQRANLALGFRPGEKGPGQMTVDQLAEAAGTERGLRQRAILIELEKRQGEKVLNSLGVAAASYEPDVQQLARKLLLSYLKRQSVKKVREALKSDQVQVRRAAAQVAGSRRLKLGSELIELLNDPDPGVRQAARQALVSLSRGQDYGPEATATESERAEAMRRWGQWWSRQAQR
jgi:hypothetical protein